MVLKIVKKPGEQGKTPSWEGILLPKKGEGICRRYRGRNYSHTLTPRPAEPEVALPFDASVVLCVSTFRKSTVTGRRIELGREVDFARSLAPSTRLPFDQTSEDEVLCVERAAKIKTIYYLLQCTPIKDYSCHRISCSTLQAGKG